ncbi:uncharacterized protein [Physcomitrium patens]|uniref:Uncharacterized protein n=1 Tax=Physcomitrium patens TaxID=3218 RepID=A0A2K1IJD9_PHYPA|nr:uncharacterized protein LOC112275586 [Physcomitrium patens]PNR29390.1 hypothetical protein PHYPA_028083 [Physcomitrium patens]|eukprot:XP_024361836.1 uncharacterized protein LOC112275586 [Physcomitrella patens]
MCPLRVILLFLSAILAGYLAVKTVKAQQESSILDPSEESPKQAIEHKGLFAVVSARASSALSVTIDMLSGRYLYQTLRKQANGEAVADQ